MTTPFSGEPLTAPTYPSTLDEQLRALETDEWVLRFAESRRRLAARRPIPTPVPLLVPRELHERPQRPLPVGRAIPHVLPVQADRRGPRPLGPHRQRRPRPLARHAPGAVPGRRARLLQRTDARRVGPRNRDLPRDAVRERHRHRVRPAPDELAKAPQQPRHSRHQPGRRRRRIPSIRSLHLERGRRLLLPLRHLQGRRPRPGRRGCRSHLPLEGPVRVGVPRPHVGRPLLRRAWARTAPSPTSGPSATTGTCCFCSATSAPAVTTSAGTTTPRTASLRRLTDA